MVKNPHIVWASVAIIFLLVAGAVLLTLQNKDVGVVLALAGIVAVPVLGAFGVAIYQKLDQVKELSNGSNTQLLNMVKELHETVTSLALQVRPPEPDKTEVPWKK
jgi:NADH:ubiquinone oxidoreductase subunit 6 (subunit J)